MIVTRTGIYWRNGGGIGWEGVLLFGGIAAAVFLTADRWWLGFLVLAMIPLLIAMAAWQKGVGIPFDNEKWDAARYRKALEEIEALGQFSSDAVEAEAARIASAALHGRAGRP